jgi:hypothetical protein
MPDKKAHAVGVVGILVGVCVCAHVLGADPSSFEVSQPPSRPPASCIATFAERPCDLLTESLVRKHVPVTAAIEQVDVGARLARPGSKPRTSRTTAFNGCTYRWDSGRSVEVRSILVLQDKDPLARFTSKWREPTPEERAHLERQMTEAMEKARQDGKVSNAGAGAGRQLSRSVAQAPVSFDPVDGVGTAARWGGVGADRSLKVLHTDTEFAVVVSVSGDESVNRTAAIAIAGDLLARCGN